MTNSTCLHIQDRESGPIRVVQLPGISVRIGRAAYCEVRLSEHDLADLACRLKRRGKSWFLVPAAIPSPVRIQGRPLVGACPLPYDLPFHVGGYCLTLRQDQTAEPDWGMYAPPGSRQLEAVGPAAGMMEATASRALEGAPAADSPAAVRETDAAPSRAPEGRSATTAPNSTPAEILKHRWESRWRAAGAEIKTRAARHNRAGEPARPAYGTGFESVPLKEARIPHPGAPVSPRAGTTDGADRGQKGPALQPDTRLESLIHADHSPAASHCTVETPLPTRDVPPIEEPRDLPAHQRAEATGAPPSFWDNWNPPDEFIDGLQQPAPPLDDGTQRSEPRGACEFPGPQSRILLEIPADEIKEDRPVETAAVATDPTPPQTESREHEGSGVTDLEFVPLAAEGGTGAETDPPARSADENLGLEPLSVPSTLIAGDNPPLIRGRQGGLHGAPPDSACGRPRPASVEISPALSLPLAPLDRGEWLGRPPSGPSGHLPPGGEAGETLLETQRNKTRGGRASNPVGRGGLFNTPAAALVDEGGGFSGSSAAQQVEPVLAARSVGAGAKRPESSPAQHHEPRTTRSLASVKPGSGPAQGRSSSAQPDQAPDGLLYAAPLTEKRRPVRRGADRPAEETGNGADCQEWPSASEILAAHRAAERCRAQPAARKRSGFHDLPTDAREPGQWVLPAWLAGPPIALFVLVCGTASCILSSAWASDSYSASIMTERLVGAQSVGSRRPLPDGVVPPDGSWVRTTAQHLVHWGLYESRSGDVNPDAASPDVRSLFVRALQVSPINATARLALAQLDRPERASVVTTGSLGLSRDVLSLAASARWLLAAGKKDAALEMYRKALEIASHRELTPYGAPRFSDDPAVPRYLLPGEQALREVVRALTSQNEWTFAEWSRILPKDTPVPLIAARLLREEGRHEADELIERFLRTDEGSTARLAGNPMLAAARAEAHALLSHWKESEEEYQHAIELVDDDTIRRSWWFNLADIALRLEDEGKRRTALEAALAVQTSDEISRRATDSQRSTVQRARLRSTGTKAN